MPSVKPWFEEWFNHPLYLDVYSHRDDADARRLIAAVLPFLNIPAGSPVLDLACGTGRHAVVLAESGLQVTGVDLSENLLAIAGKETARLGHSIELIRSDMRYLNLKKSFSAVFSLFTSFGYFDDDRENFSVFRVISDHLEPGGWFVFDYLNDPFIRQHLVPSDERRLEGARLIQNRRIEGRVLIKQVTIEKAAERSAPNAASAAFCAKLGAQTKVNCCSLASCSIQAPGPSAQPTRQPVIEAVLLRPPSESVPSG